MIDVQDGPEAVSFARHVTLRVTTADVAGRAQEFRAYLMAVLAEQPRALLLDLTEVAELSKGALDGLGELARHQLDWPGTPVGVVCADADAESRLRRSLPSGPLVLGTSAPAVQASLDHLPPADHAATSLEPGLTAPRSARAFVARACLSWKVLPVTGHACLVTSELVTNAVLHAQTPVRLVASHCPGRVRIAVYDGEGMRNAAAWKVPAAGLVTGSGRGLLLVSSVCTAWGVHRTLDDGKVVWAVLAEGSVSSARAGSR